VKGAVEGALEAHLQQGEVLEGGEAIGIAAGDEGVAELRGEDLEALVVLLEGSGRWGSGRLASIRRWLVMFAVPLTRSFPRI
jgi:hypothetical protein